MAEWADAIMDVSHGSYLHTRQWCCGVFFWRSLLSGNAFTTDGGGCIIKDFFFAYGVFIFTRSGGRLHLRTLAQGGAPIAHDGNCTYESARHMG